MTASGRRVSRGYARGLTLTAAGVLLISFETLVLRLVSADIWTVIWWRGELLAVTILVALAVVDRSAVVPRGLGIPGFAAILAFVASVFSFVLAVNLTTVANTLVIASAAPLFAALLSWLFLRERIPQSTWLAVAVLFLGIALILSGSLQTSHMIGDLFALAYAGCLAGFFVALRRCRSNKLFPIVAYGGLLSAILASPLATPVAVSASDLWLLLGLGVIIVPASTMLLAFGTRCLPAPDVVLIMMFEMILGPLWVWLALSEVPSDTTIAGGALILVTVAAHSYWGAGRKAIT